MNAIRWKFTAGCAVFALVVAVGSGLIAGNPVGAALSRSVLAAVLFGAVGTVIQVVVATYLPELDQLFVSPGSRPGGEPEYDERRTVDIVVDGEDDIDAADLQDADEELGDGDSLDDVGLDDDDSIVETGFMDRPTSSSPDESESDMDEPIEMLSADDLITEAADLTENSSDDQTDPTDSVDPNAVDKLPDVDGFADAFDAPEAIESAVEGGTKSGSNEQDPAMMARALQTMLKRDT